MNRDYIIIHLWPKTTWFAGTRFHPLANLAKYTPDIMAVAPADAELLIADYERSPDPYKRLVARSVTEALREWRDAIAAEDDERGTPGGTPICQNESPQ